MLKYQAACAPRGKEHAGEGCEMHSRGIILFRNDPKENLLRQVLYAVTPINNTPHSYCVPVAWDHRFGLLGARRE